MQDIAFNKTSGFYDISITDGDFTSEEGLDTAILMSLLLDKRADESQISQPELRRGWLGNEQNEETGYQIGSFIWLAYQSRATLDTMNKLIDFTTDCFSWMIRDSLIKDITVDGTLVSDNIIIDVTFIRFDNSIFNEQFELWENTSLA